MNPDNTTTTSSFNPTSNLGYIAFRLGKEEYLVDILKVKEICGYKNLTPIANAPEFVMGFVNLRDVVVPIIDMRIRFNLGKATYDEFTAVMVLNIHNRIVGMVVDSLSDVTKLRPEQIWEPREIGKVFDANYLDGLRALEERMTILIDFEKLMTIIEVRLIDSMMDYLSTNRVRVHH
jgi:purine-binding chemotaxis protein CheW